MNDNKATKGIIHDDNGTALLELLRTEVLEMSSTFTIYTSRKSRVWVCMRTFEPRNFSTACEARQNMSLESLLKAIAVCIFAHWHKQNGQTEQEDTWLPWQEVEGIANDARVFLFLWHKDLMAVSLGQEDVKVVDSDGVIVEPAGQHDTATPGKKTDNK